MPFTTVITFILKKPLDSHREKNGTVNAANQHLGVMVCNSWWSLQPSTSTGRCLDEHQHFHQKISGYPKRKLQGVFPGKSWCWTKIDFKWRWVEEHQHPSIWTVCWPFARQPRLHMHWWCYWNLRLLEIFQQFRIITQGSITDCLVVQQSQDFPRQTKLPAVTATGQTAPFLLPRLALQHYCATWQ